MPLSFVETMRGWMSAGELGRQGDELPISFELIALHVGGGRFEVRGLMSAPPLIDETPARGTLALGLGSIAYQLELVARDQRSLRLSAVKRPTWHSPLRSMTRMPATIRDADGRLVASGEMRFLLGDLASFAASWLPGIDHDHRLLDSRRRRLDRRALAAVAP